MAEISLFPPEFLVFVDETGFDRRINRQYGFSLKGTPAIRHAKFNPWGPRHAVVAAIALEGLLCVDIKEERVAVNADVFVDFLETHLVPALRPFNGINSRSVVVMDNAAIHHVPEVVEVINRAGAIVRFLPPYSPDLNPIEQAFATAKHFIRENDVVYLATTQQKPLIMESFAQITGDLCESYFRHSRYL
ncbi:Hypothetical predicted protein [Paramuricea clavata]|uniref:Uncharacterized protein n=1 Tax=Paramuricea clavata TaxID=317549 RepID=A0A6S7J5Y3_PARCT|nr:Hypothetical predicted protein [Paramuricea clavata]